MGEGLTSVSGRLFIEGNNKLLSDAGLESVMKVAAYLDPGSFDQSVLQAVASSPNLADEVDLFLTLDANASVSAVGDYISKRGGVFPESLVITGDVTSLANLSGLTSVGRDLWIEENDQLTSLAGLEGLINVGATLSIESNDNLTSLAGLEVLTSVGGYLHIWNNAQLTSLTGLDSLNSVGEYLSISNNDQLTSLAGLESLTSVGEVLEINNNPALSSLDGLGSVAQVGGSVEIEQNDILPDILSLEELQTYITS